MCKQFRFIKNNSSEKKTIVVVLGPTAVGKSQTSLRLAEIFNGEIINCDSMQVYKGFNIGTDKVSAAIQEKIPHHLLDISQPSHQFTAAEFVRLAVSSVYEILERDHLPIITGGTGLYLKALIYGLFPEEKKDPTIRRRLQQEAEQKGLASLRNKLKDIDPDYYNKIGANDKIRIIRALEVFYLTNKPISAHFKKTKPPLQDFKIIKIGLKLERDILYDRIEKRVDNMFIRGIIDETKQLLAAGIPENAPPFRALGYKQVLDFLQGEINMEEAISRTKTETRHYAKRQITWFKKMCGIQWFHPNELKNIIDFLSKSIES